MFFKVRIIQDIDKQGAKKFAILIRMQFLNDIIKSRHGFKTTHKITIFIKTLNL